MESVVYNQKGEKAGSVTLPEAIFGAKWNSDMVHQVVTSVLMSRRNSVAHAKTRGEVSGGGKKPWRQKGTGRARHGSIRSPIWVGGGTTHGPRNDKNFNRKVNQKMLAGALRSILSKKAKENEILFVDKFDLKEVKTKNAVSIVKALSGIKGFEMIYKKKNNAICLAIPANDSKLKRSFNNLSNISVIETRNVNAVDLLNKKFAIFVNPEESLKILNARLKSK
jgi:large subunit ribosomal protein L4